MTLAELLEKQFRPDLRFRGDGYFADDRVALRRVTPDRVYGVVRDGVDYQTQLDRSDGKLGKHCTCEQFAKLGVCKHLWATIRAIDGAKLLSGASKPGYVPPFMSDEPVYAGPDDWSDDDDEGDEFDPSDLVATGAVARRSAGRSAVAPAVAAPKLRPWEQSLRSSAASGSRCRRNTGWAPIISAATCSRA